MPNQSGSLRNPRNKQVLKNRLCLAALLMLTVLAAFARFHNLGAYNLWFDEAWVANSIAMPTIQEMIFFEHPQTTPVLFLIIERFITHFLGHGEAALRLLPAIAGILSVPLIFALTRKLTGCVATALLTASLLAFHPSLIHYSQELKPYMSDVFFALLLALLTERVITRHWEWSSFLLLAGATAISFFFSHTTPFVVSAIVCRFLWDIHNRRRAHHQILRQVCDLLNYVLLAALALAINYFFFIQKFIGPWMYEYWAQYFFSLSHPRGALSFLFKKTYDYFTALFPVSWFPDLIDTTFVALALFFAGSVLLFWKKHYRVLIYTFIPVLAVITASALHKYPYGDLRTSLFLTPFFFIVISFALSQIITILTRRRRVAATVLLSLLVGYFPYLAFAENNLKHGKSSDLMKPIVEYYISKRIPDDHTGIYWGNGFEFEYYYGTMDEERMFVLARWGFDRDPDPYLQELSESIEDELKGERLWMIFGGYFGNDRQVLVDFAKERCSLIDSHERYSTSAFLFSC